MLRKADEDHPRTEEAMRERYADWTERARTFLAETGLVTLPDGEKCLVDPSPVFQRPLIGVASYNGPPAFSNPAPATSSCRSRPTARPRKSARSGSSRIPTAASRRPPSTRRTPATTGTSSRERINAPRVRRVYGTPYFSEGWALYAERVMRERGFFTDPIQELYHLEATIFRAARIVVDTRLHMGEMSYDEAVASCSRRPGCPSRPPGPRSAATAGGPPRRRRT